MRLNRVVLVSLLCLAGCAGSRSVAKPTTTAGYEHVELRDVAATGAEDLNVEIEAPVGELVPQEVCNGLVTFPLLDVSGASTVMATMSASGAVVDPVSAKQLADAMTLFTRTISMSGITISLPRSRYNEVRDLRPNDRVRVRGYLSKYFAEGCDWFMRDAQRYLWVDSIERIAPAAP